jgi:hypothetical protein
MIVEDEGSRAAGDLVGAVMRPPGAGTPLPPGQPRREVLPLGVCTGLEVCGSLPLTSANRNVPEIRPSDVITGPAI